MMEAQLYAKIKERATNVYPMVAPRDYATPTIVYNRIDTSPTMTYDNDEDNGVVTFQVDVYDTSYKSAKALAKVIRRHLRTWVEVDGSIQSCLWSNEIDMVDDTTPTTLYRVMMRFRVFGAL